MTTHKPLEVSEIMGLIRNRWGVTYDLQIVVRKKSLFLHVMWSFLEQQSFPLDLESFRIHLNEVLEVLNRLCKADLVRYWLLHVSGRPSVGRALSLPLNADERAKEFVLGSSDYLRLSKHASISSLVISLCIST